MPTPGGLPRAGEVWELTVNVQGKVGDPIRVTVVRRGAGDYWSLYVRHADGREALWVDAAYFLSPGWLRLVAA